MQTKEQLAARGRHAEQRKDEASSTCTTTACAGCGMPTDEANLFMTAEGGLCGACHGEQSAGSTQESRVTPLLPGLVPWALALYLAVYVPNTASDYFTSGRDVSGWYMMFVLAAIVSTVGMLQSGAAIARIRRRDEPDVAGLIAHGTAIAALVSGVLAVLVQLL